MLYVVSGTKLVGKLDVNIYSCGDVCGSIDSVLCFVDLVHYHVWINSHKFVTCIKMSLYCNYILYMSLIQCHGTSHDIIKLCE